jgi:Na+/H+ antiporter NhaA
MSANALTDVVAIGIAAGLFVGILAWDTAHYAASIHIGMLGGSLLSGVAGCAFLLFSCRSAAPFEQVRPNNG